MDPCATRLCYLLQFLAASAEEQVTFCGDRLPERASDMLLLPGASVDDDRRYAAYQAAQEGNPLSLLAGQVDGYWQVVSGLPENTLDREENLLNEIVCLLELMTWFQGNNQGYNRFWG